MASTMPQEMQVSNLHFRGDIHFLRLEVNTSLLLDMDTQFSLNHINGNKTLQYYDADIDAIFLMPISKDAVPTKTSGL